MVNELYEKRRDQMFPKLTAAQIARLESRGGRIATTRGQVLTEPGESHRNLFVVLSGAVDLLLPRSAGEHLLTTLLPGDFAGEISTLRGVPGFARLRARDEGEVLSIEPAALRALVQTDAELSEIFMRAFILRRMGLISSPNGEVTLIGSRHSAHTLELREFLTRNSFPHVHVDVDAEAEAHDLLAKFNVACRDIPAIIGRGGRVLRNPTFCEAAGFLAMNAPRDPSAIHDLIVVGAGPAGLAAAVYAASEGLDVLVVEAFAPGGQAGASSRIENYLGFPTGISGQALAGRALVQAQKFGANFQIACDAVALHCDASPYGIELGDGGIARGRTVIVATGAQYRQLDVGNLQKYSGLGVYYAATHLEGKLCRDEEIIVVGGGNSAGQAAVFLSGTCRHVHIMVRSGGLAQSMSHYLVRRIEETPNVTLHTHTEITDVEGNGVLQRVVLRNNRSGERDVRAIGHVFLMTGATPNTRWLQRCVQLDDKGFVRTGRDLSADELAVARWPAQRVPYLLETSLPGVFAVGDVRSESVKRIASGVGEGSICVQFVHRALPEMRELQAS
jgi:thioredoxin reductase (NADPH)